MSSFHDRRVDALKSIIARFLKDYSPEEGRDALLDLGYFDEDHIPQDVLDKIYDDLPDDVIEAIEEGFLENYVPERNEGYD